MATAWLTLVHAPAFVEGVHDALLAPLARHLGAAEQARLPGFVRQRRRREFILGRVLLRHCVARRTGCPTAQIEVIERAGAGPQIVLPAVHDGPLQVSLAHAGGWIACAIGFGPGLGVDIETVHAGRDLAALSHIALSPAERHWLLGQPDRDAAFYRLWCGKEAFHKYRNNAGLPATPGLPGLDCDAGDAAPQGGGARLSTHHDHDTGMTLALCGAPGTEMIQEKIMLEEVLETFT